MPDGAIRDAGAHSGPMAAGLQAGLYEGGEAMLHHYHPHHHHHPPHGPPPPPPLMVIGRGRGRGSESRGGDPWAQEFMQMPPDARAMHHQQQQQREMEEAFLEAERMRKYSTGPTRLHHQSPAFHHQHQRPLPQQQGHHEWSAEFEQSLPPQLCPSPPPPQHQHQQHPHAASLEAVWEEAEVHAQQLQRQCQQQEQRHQQQGGEPWAQELELGEAWSHAGQAFPALEESRVEAGSSSLPPSLEASLPPSLHEDDAQATRAASGAVLEALREGGREGGVGAKMARSEFVGFISQLNKGELAFEGNTVVPRAGDFEGAWAETAEERRHQVAQGLGLEGEWEAAERAAVEGPDIGAAAGLEGAWAEAHRVRGGQGADLSGSVKAGLDEAWAQAEVEAKNADLESLWKEGAEGKDLDMDAFWDHVQSVAGEYDNAMAKDAVPGISKADAVELEASWQQQARDLEEWAARGAAEGGLEGGQAAYGFADDNEFMDHADAFAEGMALFEAGELRQAVLAFEAEVQRAPHNAEAWRMLGMTHAENDEDKRAIACLERAVDHDPHSLPTLLALGVSYVNELDSVRALQNLKAWIEHNPKYQGLEIRVDEYSDGSLMDEVMQLMLQAHDWDQATSGPGGQGSDADVQIVLGVLYNVSHDFDSATAAFRQALLSRPSDYSLWNKLGATLANSQRSQEALPAYHRALDIKPKYARGWLNLGISHANLSSFDEAAKCYLQALRLNPEAMHIWGYLRVTFTSMERFDLVQLAGQQDPSVFDAEFGR
ncbi:hypothetical protein VYU27_006049 [Nannochloropsis oceanica]